MECLPGGFLMKNCCFYLSLLLGLIACQTSDPAENEPTLFEEISADHSGMDFSNMLSHDESFNIFTYRNFYNGGGVALGDVNNDGLLDIYLTANLTENKLYINRGDFRFEDITDQAGVQGSQAWSTGVAMADINGDGWLDIYVCNSGDIQGDNKQNELFINQGDGTFLEQAEAYGLADQGLSTHAVFFDYDKDGDLDVYLLNNSYQAIGSFNKMQNERPQRDAVGGDKLFRNEGNRFVDVSEEAGIYGSIIGFGLGVSVGDVNHDTWPDIFISNDFFEKDYLYLNNQDGTFTESLESAMRSISASSMGADIADINGDGWLDIFVSDMLPASPQRLKQVTNFDNWDRFQFNKTHGYHYQFSRNMLHINNGDGTFSEMGRLANVEATDWSWGGLIFDMDNDGLKDLFVANGIYQDITDQDYLNFIDNEETKIKIITQQGIDYQALIDPIPINPVANFAFKNSGDLNFQNKAEEWGFGKKGHSNGAAYGDLNNDGALDLVVNNANALAQIFKNNSRIFFPENHFAQIKLIGKNQNTAAIGSQILLEAGGQTLYLEQMPNRGFQSSVDPKLTFGLGATSLIDKIQITWPDGSGSILNDVPADQLIELSWSDSDPNFKDFFPDKHATEFQFEKENSGSTLIRHQENNFVDFDRDRLTYHMLSSEGPAVAKGDINGDGLEDLFLGGSAGFSSQLFLGTNSDNFRPFAQAEIASDSLYEDSDALLIDLNQDGALDLVVASGGNEYPANSPFYRDRVYLNQGNGEFKKADNFPNKRTPTSSVKSIDLNKDGYLDLIVAERLIPEANGALASVQIWINDGKGNLSEQTSQMAPDFAELGMITTLAVVDWNADGLEDVIATGDWMEPTFFKNTGGKLQKSTISTHANLKGWYRSMAIADLDGNGLPDIILGNQGLNSRFKVQEDVRIQMYFHDFDQNGSLEQLFVENRGDVKIPYTLKHDLEKQIPSIRKKYIRYSNYNNQTLDQIFDPSEIELALVNEVNQFASGVLMNQGNDVFEWKAFPRMAQRSWIFAIQTLDLNEDGILDLILGGNLLGVQPEIGKSDASYGDILLGNGDGSFEYVPNSAHGLQLHGDIRSFKMLNPQQLLVIKNNDIAEIWRIKKPD